MVRSIGPWSVLILTSIVVAVLDQITKLLATDSFGPGTGRQPVSMIPGLLQLRYVENTGAAFGMFRDNTSALIAVSIVIIVVLGFLFRSMIAASPLLALGFGLQLGGALGNLVDRMRLGYVVDFIDVPNFPTFNVADSGITIGVAVLAWVLLFRPETIVDRQAESNDESGGARNSSVSSATSNSPDVNR